MSVEGWTGKEWIMLHPSKKDGRIIIPANTPIIALDPGTYTVWCGRKAKQVIVPEPPKIEATIDA
jgi:hypothetical protein